MLWTSTDTLGEPQGVLHDRDDEDGQHDAGDGPRAAEDVDAAEQDDVTTVRVMPWPASARALDEARRQDDAGERGDQAGQHEQAELRSAATRTPEKRAAPAFLPIA